MKYDLMRVRSHAMGRRTRKMIQDACHGVNAREAEASREQAILTGESGGEDDEDPPEIAPIPIQTKA